MWLLNIVFGRENAMGEYYRGIGYRLAKRGGYLEKLALA